MPAAPMLQAPNAQAAVGGLHEAEWQGEAAALVAPIYPGNQHTQN